MVADAKENMTRMFENMTEGFKAAFDTSRRTQDAFLKAVGDFWTRPGDNDKFIARGERVYREWVPFVGKSFETFSQTCDATMRSGMDVFKAACDATNKCGEGDAYDASRQMWDTTFGAVRTGFDTLGKVGAKSMETCSAFCDTVLREEPCTRGAAPSTPNKGGKVG